LLRQFNDLAWLDYIGIWKPIVEAKFVGESSISVGTLGNVRKRVAFAHNHYRLLCWPWL
jgi:hypothetical protein